MAVIKRHFLACEDIAGGSDLSTGERIFREIQTPFLWVLAVTWRNHYFARNKEALSCGRLDPAVSLSTYSTLPMEVGR